MKPRKPVKDPTYSSFVVVLLFGILFISLDFLFSFFSVSNPSNELSFLGAHQDKILRGILSICVFIIFGSHVQFTARKQKRLEDKQRQVELALLESNTKYTDILESINEAYYEISPDGTLLFWNKPLLKELTRLYYPIQLTTGAMKAGRDIFPMITCDGTFLMIAKCIVQARKFT